MGGLLLQKLLDDPSFERVVSVGRRALSLAHPKLVQAQADFTSAVPFAGLPPPEVAFSALGTTIKKAGSRGAFRAVDHDAVLTFARAARSAGAKAFLHVSALGASPGSWSFYGAVKGEMEADVARLGFESVYALRPSLLDGDRAESRPAERAGLVVARLLAPLLGKYRPTRAEDVALALAQLAKAPAPGVHVVSAERIPVEAGKR